MSFSCIPADNAGTANWIGICASDDFKNIACISTDNNTTVKISNDYGNTWYNTTNGLATGTNTFRAICCSSDFSKITVVRDGTGVIWRSSDYGFNWANVPTSDISNGAGGWYSVCGTPDMSIQYAVQESGNVFISTNSGARWAAKTSTSRPYRGVCCDSTGTKVAVVSSGANGFIWTSTDSGNTWTQRTTPTARDWRSIACTPDFTKLVAVVSGGGGIWTSTDSGVTWTETTAPKTNMNYSFVACSADFKNIIATSYASGTSYVYSTNYGSTWISHNVNGLWDGCVIKNNKFAAVLRTSNVYVGRFDYDTSLFKIKGTELQKLYSSVTTFNANTGVIIDQPVNYSAPVYQFSLTSGRQFDGFTDMVYGSNSYTNQISTGLDKTNGLARNGTNVVFRTIFGTGIANIPNLITQPSGVIDCSNAANTTSVSYLQNTTTVSPYQSVSVSFWIRPKTLGVTNKYTILFDLAGNSVSIFTVGFDGNSNEIVFAINNDFTNKPNSTTVLNASNWYHVVCTFNGINDKGSIYINNVLEATYSYGVNMNTISAMLVGMKWGGNNSNTASNPGSQGYNGYMAYMNVFNRELTPIEVAYLYNNPTGNITLASSPTTLFKGVSTATGYATSGGGLPMIRGQPPFGATPYSKISIPFRIAGQTIPEFAPFYTVYEGTTPLTGAVHSLQPWTTRIFVIAIGGGGGGGGGNYAVGGLSGGGGGGGGGAGMAYAYCSATSNDVIKLDVSGGGLGGFTGDIQGSGTRYYVGGNGLDGTTTGIFINDISLVSGTLGLRAKNTNNTNTNRSSFQVNGTPENNPGGAGGNGGVGTIGLYANILLSGTISGTSGGTGEDDPESTSRPSNGGTSGSGGNNNTITINGQALITDSADIKFINYIDSYVFCSGSTFRTKYGAGGAGGKGESRQGSGKTDGSPGQPGAVFIFEYCV